MSSAWEAIVKTPIYRAIEEGGIARFEEISRCALEVQDALISILSEKTIAIPELGDEVKAKRGFSIIATANTRNRGVNEMSAGLQVAVVKDENRIHVNGTVNAQNPGYHLLPRAIIMKKPLEGDVFIQKHIRGK